MSNVYVSQTPRYKSIVVPDSYHMLFDKFTGTMWRWGTTKNDDAIYAPAPEIADIEVVVEDCYGTGSGPCAFCYKSNTTRPARYMTLATYQRILNAFPKQDGIPFLTQVALGITGVQSNPDFVAILEYTRSLGIIPNFTLTGVDLTDATADRVAELCGAVAVSAYPSDKQLCYNTVQRLTQRGMQQVNIHLLYHADKLDFVYEVLQDVQTDPRLKELNAVVLLAAKPKGRGKRLDNMAYTDFLNLVDYIFKNQIPVGFDSCSASRFIDASRQLNPANLAEIEQLVEPCESFGLFSTYVNVDGEIYPCSFAEGEPGWEQGISVLTDGFDFDRDVWHSEKMNTYRAKSLANNRACILFDLEVSHD